MTSADVPPLGGLLGSSLIEGRFMPTQFIHDGLRGGEFLRVAARIDSSATEYRPRTAQLMTGQIYQIISQCECQEGFLFWPGLMYGPVTSVYSTQDNQRPIDR